MGIGDLFDHNQGLDYIAVLRIEGLVSRFTAW
jgi:hypothetical protein